MGLAVAIDGYFSSHFDPENSRITAAGISGIPDDVATAIIGLLRYTELKLTGVLFPPVFYRALHGIIVCALVDQPDKPHQGIRLTVRNWARGLRGGEGLELSVKFTMERVFKKLKDIAREVIPETGVWNPTSFWGLDLQ